MVTRWSKARPFQRCLQCNVETLGMHDAVDQKCSTHHCRRRGVRQSKSPSANPVKHLPLHYLYLCLSTSAIFITLQSMPHLHIAGGTLASL